MINRRVIKGSHIDLLFYKSKKEKTFVFPFPCCGGLTRTDDLWVMSPTSYQNGCGGLTRTDDLWVMSPTSYQLLHSAMLITIFLNRVQR